MSNEVEYAGFMKRFIAAFIDGIILTVVCRLVIGPKLALDEKIADIEMYFVYMILYYMGATILTWIYSAGLESSPLQARPGKIALGIIVTDLQGNRISFIRASIRFFSKLISWLSLCIGFIMASFTEENQALHDMMARSWVIKGSGQSISIPGKALIALTIAASSLALVVRPYMAEIKPQIICLDETCREEQDREEQDREEQN